MVSSRAPFQTDRTGAEPFPVDMQRRCSRLDRTIRRSGRTLVCTHAGILSGGKTSLMPAVVEDASVPVLFLPCLVAAIIAASTFPARAADPSAELERAALQHPYAVIEHGQTAVLAARQ